MTYSAELFERAERCIPGGVNSPVRAFRGVGGIPLFIARGEGAYLIDVDGKRYVDYIGSWGPLILGHAYPTVIKAVQETAARGLSFGAPSELEVQLAEKVCSLMPNIEMIRMVNSGTEATMTALRLARGYTKRDKIIKFIGCYHGHHDALLVKAGSGALTLGVPDSAGVPAELAQHTLLANFNDISSVAQLFKSYSNQIAAVIVEPVAGNMNCIPPVAGFLNELRSLCDNNGSVLIFDEVMTGFRVALGGAQAVYNVKPDLTTLGKIIGGGMPVGAIGGSKEIMSYLAPLGSVYQAGTLSGNPIAMAAGLATLNEIAKPGFYESLATTTQQLLQGLQARAEVAKIPFATQAVGSMFGLFFNAEAPIRYYEQVQRCDLQRFKKFFHGMLLEGVYLAPAMFEAGFISSMHHATEITLTLDAAEKVFSQL